MKIAKRNFPRIQEKSGANLHTQQLGDSLSYRSAANTCRCGRTPWRPFYIFPQNLSEFSLRKREKHTYKDLQDF
jgi:hypothetical protein